MDRTIHKINPAEFYPGQGAERQNQKNVNDTFSHNLHEMKVANATFMLTAGEGAKIRA
jgi:hypothetical protein